jgi:Fic family protein
MPERGVTVPRSAQQWLEVVAESDRAPVLGRASQPPREILSELERRGALIRLPGDVVVVKRPHDPDDEVLRRVYWPIVQTVLENYQPSVVERDSAVRILVGDETPPRVLRIRNGRNASNFQIRLADDLTIVLASGTVNAATTQEHEVTGASITMDDAAHVLLGLELRFLRENLTTVSIWLRSLVLPRASVEAAYRDRPRPVVLRRLAHLADDAGNHALAEALADVVRQNQEVRIGRGQTGVGRELVVPPRVRDLITTRRPWLDRLVVQIESFSDQITGLAAELDAEPPAFETGELLAQATRAKSYDVYHSTSIEGYRIRYEDVSVLLGGTPVSGGLTQEEVRTRMAVLGYSNAFDDLIRRIDRGGQHLPIDTALILDLYTDLFRPSVEAGIVDAEALRGWRDAPVFIRSTRYVPPAAKRVGEMMNTLMERLARLDATVVKAVLAHLALVTIHPFPDGNGRVARLLMNAILVGNGWPWLTIREQDRRQYFEALSAAQLDEDARPFGKFIIEQERELIGAMRREQEVR